MEIPVINSNGDSVGTVSIPDNVFDVAMNRTLVHQALVIYQGNQRQGTHSTKTRAQVSGGGRKPWIQKHTGRARQGSIRSPQWRHGGVSFGPHPRDYRKSLPTRMRRQAVKCVLSEKIRAGNLICINNVDTIDGKTKSMVQLLKNIGISGTALVVTPETNKTLVQASNNIDNIWTLPVGQLNANELLKRKTVLITQDAVEKAGQIWNSIPDRGGRRKPLAVNTVENVADNTENEPAKPTRTRRRKSPDADSET